MGSARARLPLDWSGKTLESDGSTKDFNLKARSDETTTELFCQSPSLSTIDNYLSVLVDGNRDRFLKNKVLGSALTHFNVNTMTSFISLSIWTDIQQLGALAYPYHSW